MKRYKINELEKIVSEDLNDLQKTIHESIYDKILYPFLKNEDGVLGDSFTVTRLSATEISVEAGRGFKYDGTQVSPEPKYRAMDLASDLTLTVGVSTWAALPSAGNSRYDLILVRPTEVVVTTEERFVKDAVTGLVSAQTVDKILEQQAEFQVYEGVAGGSPAIPATPAGWMKIAEVLVSETGIDSVASVVDTRNVLLPAIQTFSEFDRYVAPSGVGTDTTLAAAISNMPVGGGSIFIMEDCTLGTSVSVPTNVIIVGKTKNTKITFTAGGLLTFSGGYSRLSNLTIKTTETTLVPMVKVDGADFVADNVYFDLPVGGANTGIQLNGNGFNVENCTFMNSDKGGTNKSVDVVGTPDVDGVILNISSGFEKLISVSAAFTVTHAMAGKILLIDSTGGAFGLTMPTPKRGFSFKVKDKGGVLSTYAVTMTRAGAEKIENLAANYILEADNGEWEIFADGTDWWIR